MKLLAFILSFLMLGLTLLPCADEDFLVGTGKIRSEISKQHNQHHEHNDVCSPFCHCTCCAGFSINHVFIATSTLIPVNTRSYSSYLPGNLIEYSSPVWQPPKMA